MSRLEIPDDEETKGLFEEISSSRGWVSNLLASLANSKPGLTKLQAVGHFSRYESELTEREREIVILATGRNVPYVVAHHFALAVQTGITHSQCEAIVSGRVPEDFSDSEQSLLKYVFEFMSLEGVSDRVFQDVCRFYGSRQVTDASIVSSYYIGMAAIIIGLQVETESEEVLEIERDWQRKHNNN